jgi:hypothetical protein
LPVISIVSLKNGIANKDYPISVTATKRLYALTAIAVPGKKKP